MGIACKPLRDEVDALSSETELPAGLENMAFEFAPLARALWYAHAQNHVNDPPPMALRIYFAGSIRGGRDDVLLYMKIIKILQCYGTVLTEHVADPKLEAFGMAPQMRLITS